jgi:hypothetical protein
LAVIAGGKSVTAAARQVGMSRQAVYDWKQDDPTFAAELAAAYEEGTDQIADYILDLGHQPGNLAGLIYLLKQRCPERFNRAQVEVRVSGNAANPVAVDHVHRVADDGTPIINNVLIRLPPNGRDKPEVVDAEAVEEVTPVNADATGDDADAA